MGHIEIINQAKQRIEDNGNPCAIKVIARRRVAEVGFPTIAGQRFCRKASEGHITVQKKIFLTYELSSPNNVPKWYFDIRRFLAKIARNPLKAKNVPMPSFDIQNIKA
jgi:hypothetical protein